MFKFMFGRGAGKPAAETQRQTVARAVEELNGVLAGMTDKAVVGIDLNSGLLTVELPEQMPDEALALPAPEVEEDTPNEEKAAA